jgi:hypothetical protein
MASLIPLRVFLPAPNLPMLAITISATKGYLFAWESCVLKLAVAASHIEQCNFIFSTDNSQETVKAFELSKEILPDSWTFTILKHPISDDTSENYKIPAQLRIAQLQGYGFVEARKLKSDFCLNLESDVLIRPDAIRMLIWALQMPQSDGSPYYDIAMATYPNGLFLGGFGSPQHPIAQDFLPNERKLPEELAKRLKEREDETKKFTAPPDVAWMEEGQKLHEELQKCPPIADVWELNSKGKYRQRGWLDFAYPGIGKGALVPTDWVGLGCTLLSKKALALADFSGYDGKGTQDLFLCWKRWHPAGLRMCVSTHTPCDHVKPVRDEGNIRTGKYTHFQAFHEQIGEATGHLRCQPTEFIQLGKDK